MPRFVSLEGKMRHTVITDPHADTVDSILQKYFAFMPLSLSTIKNALLSSWDLFLFFP